MTMAISEILALGKITSLRDGVAIFNPTGTNYELHLATGPYDGRLNVPVKAVIRVVAQESGRSPAAGISLPRFSARRGQFRARADIGSEVDDRAGRYAHCCGVSVE